MDLGVDTEIDAILAKLGLAVKSTAGKSLAGDDASDDDCETAETPECEPNTHAQVGGVIATSPGNVSSKKSKKLNKKKGYGFALLAALVLTATVLAIGLELNPESSESSYLQAAFAPAATTDTEQTPKPDSPPRPESTELLPESALGSALESNPCVEEEPVRALLVEKIAHKMKESGSYFRNHLRGNDESTSELTRMHMVQQLTSHETERKNRLIRRRLSTTDPVRSALVHLCILTHIPYLFI